MSRYTKKQIAEAKEILSYVINGDEAETKPFEDSAGEAELIEALVEHYDDFAGSELAEASRKRTATKENPKGRCGLYSLVMTWAVQNKDAEAKAWCLAKGSSKNLRKWFSKATK